MAGIPSLSSPLFDDWSNCETRSPLQVSVVARLGASADRDRLSRGLCSLLRSIPTRRRHRLTRARFDTTTVHSHLPLASSLHRRHSSIDLDLACDKLHHLHARRHRGRRPPTPRASDRNLDHSFCRTCHLHLSFSHTHCVPGPDLRLLSRLRGTYRHGTAQVLLWSSHPAFATPTTDKRSISSPLYLPSAS